MTGEVAETVVFGFCVGGLVVVEGWGGLAGGGEGGCLRRVMEGNSPLLPSWVMG